MRRLALPLALVAFVFLPARAQQYPSRPVTLVVPFAAGGASDVLMRLVTNRMAARLGQPFVIDNRAGANGKVGMTFIARAAPDGYTLGVGATATLANNPAVYKDLPYDAARDFAAVAMVGVNTSALVVNNDVPVRSVDDLLRAMRSKRMTFSFGSAGVGNTAHLAGELFKHLTKVEMEHVPYRGGNEIMRDLMSGQIQLAFSPLLESMPYVLAGKIRALAVTRSTRLPELPDTPTMIEAGVPGIDYTSWQGIVAPAQTPREIVLVLNHTINEILAETQTREALRRIVTEPSPMTTEAFADFMDRERRKWGDVARLVGVQID